MVSQNDLIQQLSGAIGKKTVIRLSCILKEEKFALRDLIDLTFYADNDVTFRAAWILENIFLEEPLLYLDDLEYLLSRIKDVKHASCQRHYAKMLMHITSTRTSALIKQALLQCDLEPAVEQCFDWLINPKVKIAVKVFAADALCNLRHRYTWVAEELQNQIEFMMRNGSPAIQSRGKKLLTRLS